MTKAAPAGCEHTLTDVQSSPSSVALDIDRVIGRQHTVASVDMGVDLPAAFKGTHMSRFLEALENWREASAEELDYASMKRLLSDVLTRLHARRAYARFSFPYFRMRKAPVSGRTAPVRYLCHLTGELEEGREGPRFLLEPGRSPRAARRGAHGPAHEPL